MSHIIMNCPSITEILLHLQTDSTKTPCELKVWMVAEGHLVELGESIGFLRERSIMLITVSKHLGMPITASKHSNMHITISKHSSPSPKLTVHSDPHPSMIKALDTLEMMLPDWLQRTTWHTASPPS